MLTKATRQDRSGRHASRDRRRLSRARPTARRLYHEPLEDRRLLSLSYLDFGDPSGLNLLGQADTVVDDSARSVLRLTPAEQGSTGGAWFTEQQFVSADFETTFQFSMNDGSDGGDGTDGSDGFAFVIQNYSVDATGRGGNGLGYDGVPNSLAVEFDTYGNSELNDPSKSHVSVHTRGREPNDAHEDYSLGSYDTYNQAGFILDDAQVHTATISYDSATQTLSVSLDDLGEVLTVLVDLAEPLDLDIGRAWVGFVGATGGGRQNHDILSWQYASPADTSPVIAIGDVEHIEGDLETTRSFDFPVTVARPDTTGDLTVEVTYATEDGTALASAGDYTSAGGTLTIDLADGEAEVTRIISVLVNGDDVEEAHERFFVNLVSSDRAMIVDGRGIAAILNDETSVSIDNALAVEGDDLVRFIDDFVVTGSGRLSSPRHMAFGPDGLYVANAGTDEVLLYDGNTGAYKDVFVASGSGLDSPWALAFGPDDNLYVGGGASHNVLRYDGTSGLLIDEFVPSSSGLNVPKGLAFDLDGNLYVSSGDTGPEDPDPDQVLRFAGPFATVPGAPLPAPGQSGAVFIADGDGGVDALDNPNGLAFDGDHLYVCNARHDSINRYDATDGTFDNVFVPAGGGGLDVPNSMVFRPDGYLYVTSQGTHEVLRYDAASGSFVDVAASSRSGGLQGPYGLVFDPHGNLYVASRATSQVLRYGPGSMAAFTVTLSSPTALPVTVGFATADGTATVGSDYVSTEGNVAFDPEVITRSIIVPTLEETHVEADETFVVGLSNPGPGVTIADGEGIGTITEDVLRIESRVNATVEGMQDFSDYYVSDSRSVAMDSAGNTVVVWEGNGSGDDAGIFAQRYDDGGRTLGQEFQVNSTTSGAQSGPLVAKASQIGSFVVVWDSNHGVYGQLFDADGVPLNSEFEVISGGWDHQRRANSVGMDANGNFVVGYTSEVQKGIDDEVFFSAQRFDSSGQAQGKPIKITSKGVRDGFTSSAIGEVDMGADGRFVIAWEAWSSIYAQPYDSSGKAVGPEIEVGDGATLNHNGATNVAMDAAGGFVVTWFTDTPDGERGVGRVFDANGTLQGTLEFDPGGYTPATQPAMAMQADGRFILAWDVQPAPLGWTADVYAQRFLADGTALDGMPFLVNTTTFGDQSKPSVAVDDAGDFVVAWVGDGPGDSQGIFAQRFLGLPASPSLSISNAQVTEGDEGATVQAVFTVSLSISSDEAITVDYVTADDTATAGSDYVAVSVTTLSFAPGETSKDILVTVNGDAEAEGNESFFVNLSSVSSNATIADNQGVGTIRDDDSPGDVYPSLDVPLAIADRHPVKGPRESSSQLVIQSSGVMIARLDVDLSIDHGSPSDLRGYLIREVNGTETGRAELFNHPQTLQGTYIDVGFADQSLDATWVLSLWDDVKGNTGTLTAWSITVTAASPLLADGTGGHSAGSLATLSQPDAEQAAAAAVAMWAQRVEVVTIPSIDVRVADLPAGQLGLARGYTITLDVNANGAGWFVDPTPGEHGEFIRGNSAALGHVDLLTVASHEIGHLLGHQHNSLANDLMAASLPLGSRRLPGLGQIQFGPTAVQPLSMPGLTLAEYETKSVADSASHGVAGDPAYEPNLNLLLEPLVTERVERTRGNPEADEVRHLNNVLGEESELLDEELLALLARGITACDS